MCKFFYILSNLFKKLLSQVILPKSVLKFISAEILKNRLLKDLQKIIFQNLKIYFPEFSKISFQNFRNICYIFSADFLKIIFRKIFWKIFPNIFPKFFWKIIFPKFQKLFWVISNFFQFYTVLSSKIFLFFNFSIFVILYQNFFPKLLWKIRFPKLFNYSCKKFANILQNIFPLFQKII